MGKAVCVGCGNFFEESKLKKVGKKNYCRDCLEELLDEDDDSSKKTTQPATQIIIQQQQQQQQTAPVATETKKAGSWFWLCFWIIICWPVAIYYYITRKWD
jgi:hypothetical protein